MSAAYIKHLTENGVMTKEAEDIYMYPYPIAPEEEADPMSNLLCMESSLCEHLLKAKRDREQGVKGFPAREVLAKMDAIINSVEAEE